MNQSPNQYGNSSQASQGGHTNGRKTISQMPYMTGTNDPIKQTPKQMGGDFPRMGQTPYQTGTNQNKQGIITAKSGSQYRTDLKDLIPNEHY